MLRQEDFASRCIYIRMLTEMQLQDLQDYERRNIDILIPHQISIRYNLPTTQRDRYWSARKLNEKEMQSIMIAVNNLPHEIPNSLIDLEDIEMVQSRDWKYRDLKLGEEI